MHLLMNANDGVLSSSIGRSMLLPAGPHRRADTSRHFRVMFFSCNLHDCLNNIG